MTLVPRSHINKPKCPCCEKPLQMTVSKDDHFVFVWYCRCGFNADVVTGTMMVPSINPKELKHAGSYRKARLAA